MYFMYHIFCYIKFKQNDNIEHNSQIKSKSTYLYL